MSKDDKEQDYIWSGIIFLCFTVLLMFMGVYVVIKTFPVVESISTTALFSAPFWGISICLWLFMGEIILGSFRIIDYRKNKNNILESKEINKGKVIKIKKAGRYGGRKISQQWDAYYLVVDVNGEKVKSIFFENDIYKIGQELNIVSYNGREYVILESEKEKTIG